MSAVAAGRTCRRRAASGRFIVLDDAVASRRGAIRPGGRGDARPARLHSPRRRHRAGSARKARNLS
ncbi:hypothetical protein [Lysobacter gummosus]|uniref:hypothetical protein n=1 Tax=Lysobacter gummosus TaxID=262324 RepID=UPI00363E5700